MFHVKGYQNMLVMYTPVCNCCLLFVLLSCVVRCSWVVDTYFIYPVLLCRMLSRRWCQQREPDAPANEERIILGRDRRIRPEKVLAIAHREAAGARLVFSSEISNRFDLICFFLRVNRPPGATDMPAAKHGVRQNTVSCLPACPLPLAGGWP